MLLVTCKYNYWAIHLLEDIKRHQDRLKYIFFIAKVFVFSSTYCFALVQKLNHILYLFLNNNHILYYNHKNEELRAKDKEQNGNHTFWCKRQ